MKVIRIFTAVVFVAALSAAAVIGGQRIYRYSAIKEKLQQAVGKDEGYTETLLRVESDSSHMTFGELFQLCDKSIEGRTDLIIELRGLYPSINHRLREELISYLNAENEFARTKRDYYRKQMEFSSAVDLYKEAVEDTPRSDYGDDFYRSTTDRREAEVKEAALQVQNSAKSFIESYISVLGLEDGMARAANGSGVRFVLVFKQYEKENRTAAENTEQIAIAYLK